MAKEYTTPQTIKDKVTIQFATLFLKKLIEIFKVDSYDEKRLRNLIDIIDIYMHSPSTFGWTKAFYEACDETGLLELKKYCDALEWYQFDIFCDDISKLCIDMVVSAYIKGSEQS